MRALLRSSSPRATGRGRREKSMWCCPWDSMAMPARAISRISATVRWSRVPTVEVTTKNAAVHPYRRSRAQATVSLSSYPSSKVRTALRGGGATARVRASTSSSSVRDRYPAWDRRRSWASNWAAMTVRWTVTGSWAERRVSIRWYMRMGTRQLPVARAEGAAPAPPPTARRRTPRSPQARLRGSLRATEPPHVTVHGREDRPHHRLAGVVPDHRGAREEVPPGPQERLDGPQRRLAHQLQPALRRVGARGGSLVEHPVLLQLEPHLR